ncbi:MAG: sugar phosphate isomerase/epimerase [Clostridia bacterium]|nr:sugar phosphate isomerase/epimerase [Clostridia bacterium]
MPNDFGMPFLLETPTIADAAALCAELGLSFVELNMNFPACQADGLDVQELYALKRRYGIYFTIHLEEGCDPFCFNLGVRRAWLDSIRNALTIAQAIDAPIVNMHLPKGDYITLPDRRVHMFEHYSAFYHEAVLALRDMCQQELEGSGTRICIENTKGFAPYEQATITTLLESPVFGLTLDIGHSHAVGDRDIPFYQVHDQRLIHMHGHDARGKSNHLALGDGEIDLAGCFAWAKRNDARVVLETKTVQALRTSVERLRRFV